MPRPLPLFSPALPPSRFLSQPLPFTLGSHRLAAWLGGRFAFIFHLQAECFRLIFSVTGFSIISFTRHYVYRIIAGDILASRSYAMMMVMLFSIVLWHRSFLSGFTAFISFSSFSPLDIALITEAAFSRDFLYFIYFCSQALHSGIAAASLPLFHSSAFSLR